MEELRRESLFSPSRAEIACTSEVNHSDQPDRPNAGPKRPRTPLLNTYKMHPDVTFKVKVVEDSINQVLKEQLHDDKYDAHASSQMSKTLATIISKRVRALNFDRYKIVTLVTVGQLADQGIRVASRCLMDKNTDKFASGSFKNNSLFAVATVYGFYYE